MTRERRGLAWRWDEFSVNFFFSFLFMFLCSSSERVSERTNGCLAYDALGTNQAVGRTWRCWEDVRTIIMSIPCWLSVQRI